jgi:hypothetical protein
VYVWLGDESGVDVGFFSCVCANFDNGLMMLGVSLSWESLVIALCVASGVNARRRSGGLAQLG